MRRQRHRLLHAQRAGRASRCGFASTGRAYDWGTLRWCQTYADPPNGCYDAETIALDEFGHVEVLGHHDNYADDRDYTDAVVQTFSRTKPKVGWDMHAFGPCDTATLQVLYDMPGAQSPYSTCLDIATALGLSVNDASIAYGTTVTLTASCASRSTRTTAR